MATTSTRSLCGVSSSESSDEDEHGRFLEAAVLDCHHSTSQNGGTMPNGCNGGRSMLPSLQQRNIPTKPSLRPSKQETHEAENELDTTPEFRAHVGKKLSQIIDNMIDVGKLSKSHSQPNGVNPETEEGIRLFMKSSKLVDTAETSSNRKPVKKRPVESSSSDSSEDERIASAAVSRDFIFKDSMNLSVTEQFSKPEVDRLKSEVDCSTEGKTKKKKKKKHKDSKNDCVESVCSNNDVKDESLQQSFKKCKKKKRKKKNTS